MDGTLGAAFELRPTIRRRSSASSSLSSSFDFSSTDDEISVTASPCDNSWSTINSRDPFSASAKPVDGLKLYSRPDASSRSSPRGGIGRVAPGEITPRGGTDDVPSHIQGGRERNDASENTPVYRPSSKVAGRPFDETIGNSEAQYWDTVLSNAIDKPNGKLDLSFPRPFGGHNFNAQLTYVPPSISDLRKLVVLSDKCTTVAGVSNKARPFTRITSAPASYSLPHRIPAASKQEAEIQLYLTGNALCTLPRELFSLKGLTVLILRGNQIEYLPASICCLTSLKELNLSNNRIQYLPAEILQLSLDSLRLAPNPFLKPPEQDRLPSPGRAMSFQSRRVLGPRTRHWPDQGPVPPLHEIAYRVLLSPMGPAATQALNWQMYNVNEWFGSKARGPKYQEVFEVLKAATAAEYNASRHTEFASDMPNVSRQCPPNANSTLTPFLTAASHFPHTCPSPTHRPSRRFFARSTTSQICVGEERSFNGTHRIGSGMVGRAYLAHSLPSTSPEVGSPATYLSHAEEQIEWVSQIGGVKFPLSDRIPVLWRGCSNGCLSFLDDDREGPQTFKASPTVPLARGVVPVDSQCTIRQESFYEEEEDEEMQDGFDIDDLDELGA